MKFIDFDREYFDNVHKLERGSITLGEYADAGEKLLNKVKADAIDEFVAYLKKFVWWSNEADEKVIGEFALEEYAERVKEQKNAD